MSIKFPDFQVLVTRSDQVPRLNREGDQTGAAGRLAPQVTQEFAARKQRVEKNKRNDRIRDREDEEPRRQGQQGDKDEHQGTRGQAGVKRHIDLRA